MRLVRRHLTESVVLTLPSGALGVAVAYVLQGLLFHLLPVEALGVTRPTVDGLLLIFALGMSIVTGLLVGACPRSAVRGRACRRTSGPAARRASDLRARD